jgi:predicted O-methyltransferase YrrM
MLNNKEFRFNPILNEMRIDDYMSWMRLNEKHLNTIHNICLNCGETIEGNCFYEHGTLNRIIEFIPKQMNHLTLGAVSNNILEIGFNAGHSTLLYLTSNPNSKITSFDLCEHSYTLPCLEYLQKHFPNRINFVCGDSTQTLPEYIRNNPSHRFDLIHIDGGHDKEIAEKDFMNCYEIASNIIIFDDTNSPILNNIFDDYLSRKMINEIFLYRTMIYEHRIAKTNRSKR